jgi:hypothetical protein
MGAAVADVKRESARLIPLKRSVLAMRLIGGSPLRINPYEAAIKRDSAGLIPPNRPVFAVALIGGSSLRINPYECRHRRATPAAPAAGNGA